MNFYKFNYILVLKTHDNVVCCSILYSPFFSCCTSAERERYYLEGLGIDERIILKCIFSKWDGGHRLD